MTTKTQQDMERVLREMPKHLDENKTIEIDILRRIIAQKTGAPMSNHVSRFFNTMIDLGYIELTQDEDRVRADIDGKYRV